MTRVPGEVRQKPAPSASRPTTTGRQPFALMALLPDGGPALQSLRDGLIEPQDFAVLEALRQAFEWRACRCWAEWPDLAAATGLPEESVRAAAERLIRAELLAVGRHSENSGWAFWALHPHLASDGRTAEQAERLRWAQWAELVAAGARPDDRVSCSRLRYLKALARKRELKLAAAGVTHAQEPDAQAAGGAQQGPAQAHVQPGAVPLPQERVQPDMRDVALASTGRVVSIRPTDAHRAADLAWRAEAEQRRRQRQQQQAS